MAKPLLKDALSFEFDTDAGRKLSMFGELISWDDEVSTGIVEHRVLRRNGARHQNMGIPPRRFQFQCALTGANVHARYQFICDAITENPFGFLIHPRFGHRAAVCEGISAKEAPGDGIDVIYFTIRFVEDELRLPPVVSASTAASAAVDSAAALVAQVGALPAVPAAAAPAALSVQAAAVRFQVAAGDVAIGAVPVPEVATLLRDLRAAVADVDASAAAVEFYSLRALAHLSYSRALAAYNALLAGRPPIVEYSVDSPISVARLAARLYGGRFARGMAAEIKQFNRIFDPLRVPAGTVLLLSDPQVVRKNAFF